MATNIDDLKKGPDHLRMATVYGSSMSRGYGNVSGYRLLGEREGLLPLVHASVASWENLVVHCDTESWTRWSLLGPVQQVSSNFLVQ